MDYFIAISNEFEPLNNTPHTFDRRIDPIDVSELEDRLKRMHKPSSAVEMDPLPKTINSHAHLLAPILTKFINGVRTGDRWPNVWRREEVTIIPKGSSVPQDYDSCRNITCTSVFSKLCETYMIDWIMEEIAQEESQFGGFKGSGTDHLLSELMTVIMEQLEDNRAAVSLVSVNMAKAFNRMDHSVCISSLAQQGASTQTIALVANFLTGRSMRIKLGRGIFSTYHPTPGGAPQGTKSGNILFCIATAGIERRAAPSDSALPPPLATETDGPVWEHRDSGVNGSTNGDLGLTNLGGRVTSEPPSSPLGGSRLDLRLQSKMCWQNTDSEEENGVLTQVEILPHHSPP